VWPGFAGAGIAGSAFFYWKKRLREAAVPQIVEVQVGKSQLTKAKAFPLRTRIND
jgi:hypothetical protein